MKLPLAKSSDIVVQSIGKDLLIYDLVTNQAFQLNATSSVVFNACDGISTFEDLNRKHNFSEELICLTLDVLAKENLLAGEYQSKFAGISRRDVIRKVGLATMIALPVISSIVAPEALQAASICSCPRAEPAGCLNGGNYSLGCLANNNVCNAAAAASGGTNAAPNHCCSGLNSAGFTPLTGCCVVFCGAAVP